MPTRRVTQSLALAEEIERIRTLLHRLDEMLAQKEEISLKELDQAVSTAALGGRSIGQLRKLEKELKTAVHDANYDRLRANLFAMVEKLEQRRQDQSASSKETVAARR